MMEPSKLIRILKLNQISWIHLFNFFFYSCIGSVEYNVQKKNTHTHTHNKTTHSHTHIHNYHTMLLTCKVRGVGLNAMIALIMAKMLTFVGCNCHTTYLTAFNVK